MAPRQKLLALALVLLSAAARAGADFASDEAECTDQLVALMPCLAFVSDGAKAPTPECCVNAKTVVGKSFKCLCVLVKDRDEPGLGFKINVTRAVTLPGFCSVPANISDCPKLLKLQPGSAAAKEFDQLEKEIVQNTKAATAKSINSVDSKSNITASDPSGSNNSKRWFIGDNIDLILQLGIFIMVFLLWEN